MFELHPAKQALQQLTARGDFMPVAPLRLGYARFKTLTSTGHLVDRYLAAAAWLGAKLRKRSPWPELSPVLASLPVEGATFAGLQGEGVFALALGLHRWGWTIEPEVLPESATRDLLRVWHRVQPDASRRDLGLLPVPELAPAPLWSALLHLQPLRGLWEVPLRRGHLRALRQRVPSAWLLDPTPLPPGSAIPGLELASWQELSPSVVGERAFVIADALGQEPLQPLAASLPWTEQLQAALTQPPEARRILLEVPAAPQVMILALYQKSSCRTDYLGSVACHAREDGGWEASRVTA